MKTKLTIIIDSLGPGGTQRQVVEYLKAYNKDKFEIILVSLDKNYNTLQDEITKLGIKIIGIEHKGFINFKTLNTLIKFFKLYKPKVVYTFLFTADFYGRLAAKLAGVPVIISSVRGIDAWKKTRHILIDRLLTLFTDKIVVNVNNIRPFLTKVEKLPENKITTIYNGIDLTRFNNFKDPLLIRKELNIPADAIIITMVARFDEPKDYDTFIEAARIVTYEKPDIYFMAVGTGPQLEQCRTKVNELGLKNFIFTGLKKDPVDYVNASDICVLSTKREGCSNVIMEYMACGKPVVASNVGGNPELVERGKTGFLSSDKKHMAELLIKLIEDNDLRKDFGARAKEKMYNNFSVEVMARKTEELFEQLIWLKVEG